MKAPASAVWLLLALCPPALAAAGPAGAPIPRYAGPSTGSSLTFDYSNFLGTFHGEFPRFEIEAWVHPEETESTAVRLTVEMDSVTLDSPLLPDFLARSGLNVSDYPECRMRTLSVRRTSDPEIIEAVIESEVVGKTYRKTVAARLTRIGPDIRIRASLTLRPSPRTRATIHLDAFLRRI